MRPEEFFIKWKNSELRERQAYTEHWGDICRMLNQPTPTDADVKGDDYCFDKGVVQSDGKQGWADVWRRGFFAVEYKSKGKSLADAYNQLLRYQGALENPPLLIVTDMDRFEVYTQFTGAVTRKFSFTLKHFAGPDPVDVSIAYEGVPTLTPLEVLRACFEDPQRLNPRLEAERITQDASRFVGALAQSIAARGNDELDIAHFLIKLLFALFCEKIGMLPKEPVRTLVEGEWTDFEGIRNGLDELFARMRKGGKWGPFHIRWFNGSLFDEKPALAFSASEMDLVKRIVKMNWANVAPTIFGELFERALESRQRAKLGAHYTSVEDILRVVEPVIIRPLRHTWEQVKDAAEPLALRIEGLRDELAPLKPGAARDKAAKALAATQAKLRAHYQEFLHWLGALRVLDPACGSGNFLYVALRELKRFEAQALAELAHAGVSDVLPAVHPRQLYGLELSPFAFELARAVVWIGYIQWHRARGDDLTEPILEELENIKLQDALLKRDKQGKPVAKESPWPDAEFIVGNPPFLGGKLLRKQLGDEYVETLFKGYEGRVAPEADLSTYFHERARAQIEAGTTLRAGLLATQGIRGGANQKTLKKILETGTIFEAWSDFEWKPKDGSKVAAVHCSIVCQTARPAAQPGGEQHAAPPPQGMAAGVAAWPIEFRLDGASVSGIQADLTGTDQAALSQAQRLQDNRGVAFMGTTKQGPFEVDRATAEAMWASPNPNRRDNREVVRPWRNGRDIAGQCADRFIIDLDALTHEEAALYEAPFEYVRRQVKPWREMRKRAWFREQWWQLYARRPVMWDAINGNARYIVTPRVAKHRLFVWLDSKVVPDCQLIVFAREDDYFFGVLHSVAHERWALELGTQLEDRPRYTPTTCFETFPLPEPTKAQREAVAAAARKLNELRENWLNPAPPPAPAELKKRTLTNLYNERPQWLHNAHVVLDKAVLAAYGWADINPEHLYATLSNADVKGDKAQRVALRNQAEQELLKRLLALNLSRAAAQDAVSTDEEE